MASTSPIKAGCYQINYWLDGTGSCDGIVTIPISEGKRQYSAKILNDKPCWNSRLISGACLIVPYLIANFVNHTYLQGFFPLYAVIGISAVSYAPLAMIYHAVRCALIPFYIIGKGAYDGKSGKTILKCVGKQWKISFQQILKAPFYGIAFNMGHIATLIVPRIGMNWVSQIERSWNRDISARHSVSLLTAFGLVENVKFENDPDIEKMSPNAFYLLRCYQPNGELQITKNGDKFEYEVVSEGGEKRMKGPVTLIPESPWVPNIFVKAEPVKVQV